MIYFCGGFCFIEMYSYTVEKVIERQCERELHIRGMVVKQVAAQISDFF